MTLYERLQKRHRCKEQTFGLHGRRQGWDDLREWHWNMYIIICEIDHQSRFDAWDRVLRAGALGWPWGMGWEGRWEGGSGWGTHVQPWLIHVNVWQKPLQYSKVIGLQLKFKKNIFLKDSESESCSVASDSLQSYELYSPWNSPGQNTGVGSRSLLQGIFPIQGSNPGLPHCRRILHRLSHQGSPLKDTVL